MIDNDKKVTVDNDKHLVIVDKDGNSVSKHFDGYGTGIRYFVDSYVYQNAKNLDWSYIERELDKLGVLAFEKTFRSIFMKIFGKGEAVSQLSEEEYSMLCDSMFAVSGIISFVS